MIQKTALAAILLMVFLANVHGQARLTDFDRLSIQDATRMALENNPSVRIATSGYDVSNALLRQSRSGYFPVISFNASGTYTEGSFVFNPSIPVREQTYRSYTAGFQAQQLLWDFGRTSSRVSANENFLGASAEDYQSALENVIVSVQTAYYSFLQTQYVVRVDEETLQQAQEHLKVAQAFFKAGRTAEYDVTKAEVDVANAEVNLLRARNQVQIAKLQLENAIGVQNPKNYVLLDSLKAVRLSLSIDSARAIALENRSELKAANFRVQANKELLSASWAQNLPVISAVGNYNWNGFGLPLYSRWNAGLNFSLPIFQGFYVSAQVQESQANVEEAAATEDLARQNAILDVSQSYLAADEAFQRIGASEKLVQSAVENLRLAKGRYNSGVGSPTEITDAQITLSNARITNIQALYDYNTSLIRLKKSMGTLGGERVKIK
ncbi:MAG: TolC family protein [Ignavibacteria bacterium]|jgi:TolC family type I secretion outer membrane protein|nr:TolC family protein [Ignavibacteria bacterium]MCU7505195.1 TolC family protein [Ignavibacteria bacterium]MCU7518098.1 TolC family protein [Ignavibacteria bacterium]